MFRISSIILAASAAILIAGCASHEPAWRKADVDEENTYNALAECKYQVGLNKVPEDKQDELVDICMEAKGFRWR